MISLEIQHISRHFVKPYAPFDLFVTLDASNEKQYNITRIYVFFLRADRRDTRDKKGMLL